MNGADALIETFIDNDVTACFANPGASEMRDSEVVAPSAGPATRLLETLGAQS